MLRGAKLTAWSGPPKGCALGLGYGGDSTVWREVDCAVASTSWTSCVSGACLAGRIVVYSRHLGLGLDLSL
eukprot:9496306-Pyramimonas_sp.AAC.2